MNNNVNAALKAPLHDSPARACRLPCTWANRKVWHVTHSTWANRKVWYVTRMYRTGENRLKMNYSPFYFRADSVAPAVRLPDQSAVNI